MSGPLPKAILDLSGLLEELNPGPVAWSGQGREVYQRATGHPFPELEALVKSSAQPADVLSAAVGWYSSRRLEGLEQPLTLVLEESLDGVLLERLEPLAARGENVFIVLVDLGRKYAPGSGTSWLPFGLDQRKTDHLGNFLEQLGVRFLGTLEFSKLDKVSRELENGLGRSGVRVLHLMGRHQPTGADSHTREQFYLARSPLRPAQSRPVQAPRPQPAADTVEVSLMTKLAHELRNDPDVVVYWARNQVPGALAMLGDRLLRRPSSGVLAEARGAAAAGQYPIVAVGARLLPTLMPQLMGGLEHPLTLLVTGGGLSFTAGDTLLNPGALRDLALLRMVSGLHVHVPADEAEALQVIRTARSLPGALAVRFTSAPAVGMSESEAPLAAGKSHRLRAGRDLAILALGSTVFPSVLAAESLAAWGVDCTVFDVRFVEPLDAQMLEQAAACGRILTVEEHCRQGGLGTAVLEGLQQGGLHQVATWSLGLPDDEPIPVGSTMEQFGLFAEGIQKAAAQSLGLERHWSG